VVDGGLTAAVDKACGSRGLAGCAAGVAGRCRDASERGVGANLGVARSVKQFRVANRM
jgi:hypothetical protein